MNWGNKWIFFRPLVLMIDVLIGHRIHFLKQSNSNYPCPKMKTPLLPLSPIPCSIALAQTIILIILVFPACKKSPSTDSSQKKKTGSSFTEKQIETALQAQFDSVFADLKIEDPSAFEMDQQRVRDIHQIARLCAAYKNKAGHYPLVTPEGSMKNAIMVPDKEARQKSDVTFNDFVSDLKAVLGDDIIVPIDPAPGESGRYIYSYSAYGKGYAAAAYLYHHAPYSEKLGDHYCQYRVGSRENTQLPILEFNKIIDGTSTVEAKLYSRGR